MPLSRSQLAQPAARHLSLAVDHSGLKRGKHSIIRTLKQTNVFNATAGQRNPLVLTVM